jgi:hypothetical protein
MVAIKPRELFQSVDHGGPVHGGCKKEATLDYAADRGRTFCAGWDVWASVLERLLQGPPTTTARDHLHSLLTEK